MMPRRKIEGFEFMLTDREGARWVRLWGSTGLLGDGVLPMLNAPSPPRHITVSQAEASALRRARAELKIRGEVRVFAGWQRQPEERIVVMAPREIRGCRAIYPSSS